MIGSFGSSEAFDKSVFKLSIDRDPGAPVPTADMPRYGKLPEIHHVFKDAPRSPPIVITLAFVAVVGATLPILGALVGQYSMISPATC